MNSRTAKLTRALFGAALFTLPWCGVGTLRVLTGRDWGFGLQPSWVFLYAGMSLGLWSWWRGNARAGWMPSFPAWKRGPWLVLGAALLAVGLSGVGLLVAPSGEAQAVVWGRFGRQIVQLLIMWGFLLWPLCWLTSRDRWRLTLRWLLVGALFQLIYALLLGWDFYGHVPGMAGLESFFTSNPAILSGSEQLYLGDRFVPVPRLRGTVCEPLYLGNYLLLILPWLAWLGWPRRRGRLVLGAAAGLLVLTWSRGAWLSAFFQLVILFLLLVVLSRQGEPEPGRQPASFRPGRWSARGGWLALGLAGVAVLALFLWSDWPAFQYPRQRLVQTFSSRDWSNLTRLYSMQAGWRAFQLSPWVGVGWGQFSFHFPLLVDPLGLQSQFSWPVVNNFPLKVLAETGLAGFLVFLAGLGGILRGTWLRLGSVPRGRRGGILAALVAALGLGIQLLTFSQYNLPQIWVAWGLLLAAVSRPEALPFPSTGEGEMGGSE